MTARGRSAFHACEGDGNDLGAEQDAEPANGANEGLMGSPPALGAVVRPLQAAQDGCAQLGQNRLGGNGIDRLLRENVFTAIGILAPDQLGSRDPAFACEALGGLGGNALRIEGDGCRGAALDLMDRVGGCRDVGDVDAQAARRREDADLAVGQPRSVKCLGDHLPHL